MANLKVNPSSFIPSGEMMRDLANQTYISESDVKSILKKRGIVTPFSSKQLTVSILSCLLLSPSEFEILVERQTIKEDNLKSAGSGRIKVNENFTNLSTFVHDEYLQSLKSDLMNKNNSLRQNYKLIGPPIVRPSKSQSELEIEITIERNNYNKSWVNHKSQFKAIINLKQANNEIIFFNAISPPPKQKRL